MFRASDTSVEGPVLRINAEVRPGNSGGPLLDRRGRVAGVVYAVELSTGLGLAIPMSTVNDLLDQAGTTSVPPAVSSSRETFTSAGGRWMRCGTARCSFHAARETFIGTQGRPITRRSSGIALLDSSRLTSRPAARAWRRRSRRRSSAARRVICSDRPSSIAVWHLDLGGLVCPVIEQRERTAADPVGRPFPWAAAPH